MRILLIEPSYKNKYPPLGLMKISTYHKSKYDWVKFVKGTTKEYKEIDRVYITTLFSFEFNRTLETITFYESHYPNAEIYIGGISVSIMENEFAKSIDNRVKIITGQLVDSSLIGMNDNVNIDSLIPDYDILDDVDYVYPEGDSYYVHFSRGCVRNCAFCAVPKIEPEFKYTNSIVNVVKETQRLYGTKKYLKIMDNNVFYLDEYDLLIDEIKELGFTNNNKIKRESKISLMINALERRIEYKQDLTPVFNKIIRYFDDMYIRVKDKSFSKNKSVYKSRLKELIHLLNCYITTPEILIRYKNQILKLGQIFEGNSRIKQVIDFNQGVDARGMILYPERVKRLSEINLDPCRIAFDSINDKDTYIKSFRLAHSYGINTFSNYLLFNYNDTPEDLYTRMRINIELVEELDVYKQFSFPMKFVPVTRPNRNYIGKYWSKLELDGFYAILNVTRGIVAKELDFFEKAYGKDSLEFKRIITMPTILIKNRNYYEKNGIIEKWNKSYSELTKNEIVELKNTYMSKKWDAASEKVKNLKNYFYASTLRNI